MKKNNKISRHVRAFDQALLEWTAPEYPHQEKSMLWYLIAGSAALLLVFYGIWSDGWTFSLAIIIFAGTYYLFSREEPKNVSVKISKIGVKIGRHTFPYNHLKGYWTVYHPQAVKRLYLRMASRFQPDVFVSLENTDPTAVREALQKYLREFKGVSEPIADTLVRLFKL